MGISVPKGSEVVLGELEVGDEYLDESYDELSDYYTIPQMFIGTYQLDVAPPYYEKVTEEVTVDTYSSYIECSDEEWILKDELRDELKEKSKKLIEDLYTAVMNDTGLSELENTYPEFTNIRNVYADMASYIQDSYAATLDEITFSGFELYENDIVEEDGQFCMTAELYYAYEYVYSEIDWFDENVTNTGTETGNVETDFEFVLQDGEWTIKDSDVSSVF